MKHTLSLFLSLLMVFSVFSCLNISAAENGNAEVGANYNLWLGSTRVPGLPSFPVASSGHAPLTAAGQHGSLTRFPAL